MTLFQKEEKWENNGIFCEIMEFLCGNKNAVRALT